MQMQAPNPSKNNSLHKSKKDNSSANGNEPNDVKGFDVSTESGAFNDSSHFEKANLPKQGGINQRLNFAPANSSSAVISSAHKDSENPITNSSRLGKTASGKEGLNSRERSPVISNTAYLASKIDSHIPSSQSIDDIIKRSQNASSSAVVTSKNITTANYLNQNNRFITSQPIPTPKSPISLSNVNSAVGKSGLDELERRLVELERLTQDAETIAPRSSLSAGLFDKTRSDYTQMNKSSSMNRELSQEKSLLGDKSGDNYQERYVEQGSIDQDAQNKSQQRMRSLEKNKSKGRASADSEEGSIERTSTNKPENASSSQIEVQENQQRSMNPALAPPQESSELVGKNTQSPNKKVSNQVEEGRNLSEKSSNTGINSVNNSAEMVGQNLAAVVNQQRNTLVEEGSEVEQRDQDQSQNDTIMGHDLRDAKEEHSIQSIGGVRPRSDNRHPSQTSDSHHEEREVRVFSFSDRLDDPDSARNHLAQDKSLEATRGNKNNTEKVKKSHNPSLFHTNESTEIRGEVSQSSQNQSDSPQKSGVEALQGRRNDDSRVHKVDQKESPKKDSKPLLKSINSSQNEPTSKNIETPKKEISKNSREIDVQSSDQSSSPQKDLAQSSPNLTKNQLIKVDEDFVLDTGAQEQDHTKFEDSNQIVQAGQHSPIQDSQKSSKKQSPTKQSDYTENYDIQHHDPPEQNQLSHSGSHETVQKGSSSPIKNNSSKERGSEVHGGDVTPSKDSADNKSLTNYKSFDNTPNIYYKSERSSVHQPASLNSPEKHSTGEVSQNRSPDRESDNAKTSTVSEEANYKTHGASITDDRLRSPGSIQSDISMKSPEKNHSPVKDRLNQGNTSGTSSQSSPLKDKASSLLKSQGGAKPANNEAEVQDEKNIRETVQEHADVEFENNVQRIDLINKERKKKNHPPTNTEEADPNQAQSETDDRNERIRSIMQGNTNIFNDPDQRGQTQALNRGPNAQGLKKKGETNLQTITEESSSAVNQKQEAQGNFDNAITDKDSRSLSNILQNENNDQSRSKRAENFGSDQKASPKVADARSSESYDKFTANQSQKSQSPGHEGDIEDGSQSGTQYLNSGEPSPYKTSDFSNLRQDYPKYESETDAPSFKDRHFEQTFGRGSSKIASSEPSQAQIKGHEGTPVQEKDAKGHPARSYVDPSELLIRHFKTASPRQEEKNVENNYNNQQEGENQEDRGCQTAKFGYNFAPKTIDDLFDQPAMDNLSPIQQSIIRTNKMQQGKGSFGGKNASPDPEGEVDLNIQNGDDERAVLTGKDLQDIQKEVKNTLLKNNKEIRSRFNQTPESGPEELNDSPSKQNDSPLKKKKNSPPRKSSNSKEKDKLLSVYNKQSHDVQTSQPSSTQPTGIKAEKNSPEKANTEKGNPPRRNQWAARSTIEEGPGRSDVVLDKTTEANNNFTKYNPSPKVFGRDAIKRDVVNSNSDNQDPSQVLSAYSKEGSYLAEKESEPFTSQYVGKELDMFGSTLSEEVFIKDSSANDLKRSPGIDQQENEEPRLSKMSEEQAANFYEQRKNEIQRNIQKISKGKIGNKKGSKMSNQARPPQSIPNKDFSVANQNIMSSPAAAQKSRGVKHNVQDNTKRVPRSTNEEMRGQNEQQIVRTSEKNREQNRRASDNNLPNEAEVAPTTVKVRPANQQAQKNVRSQQQTPRSNKEAPKQSKVNQREEENDENAQKKYGDAIQIARDSIFQRMENIEKALNKKDSSTPRVREKSGKSEDKLPQSKQIPKTRPEGINVANHHAKHQNQSPGKFNTDQLRSPFTAKTDISTATSPHSTNLVPRGRPEKSAFSKLMESSQVDSPHTGQTKERALKTEESPELQENVELKQRESYQTLRHKNRYSKDRTSLNQPTNTQPPKKSNAAEAKQERSTRYAAQAQRYPDEKVQVIQKFDLSKKSKVRNANHNEVLKPKTNQNDSTRAKSPTYNEKSFAGVNVNEVPANSTYHEKRLKSMERSQQDAQNYKAGETLKRSTRRQYSQDHQNIEKSSQTADMNKGEILTNSTYYEKRRLRSMEKSQEPISSKIVSYSPGSGAKGKRVVIVEPTSDPKYINLKSTSPKSFIINYNDPRPGSSIEGSFEERNRKWQIQKNQKIAEKERAQYLLEVSDCTFYPNSNGLNQGSKILKPDDFYQKNMEWTERLRVENEIKAERNIEEKQKREPRKIVRNSHRSPIRRVRSQGLFADQSFEAIKKSIDYLNPKSNKKLKTYLEYEWSGEGRLNEEIAEIEELYKYVKDLVKTKLESNLIENTSRPHRSVSRTADKPRDSSYSYRHKSPGAIRQIAEDHDPSMVRIQSLKEFLPFENASPRDAIHRRQKSLAMEEPTPAARSESDAHEFAKNRSSRFQIKDNQYVLCQDEN